MTPGEQQIAERRIVGKSIRTANAREMNPDTAQIPSLWQNFFAKGLMDKVPGRIPSTPVYGVYSDYDSDGNGEYTLTAGVEVSASGVPDGLNAVDIKSGKYLVFAGQGAMPQVVIDTWGKVWQFFSGSSDYERAYTTDFEIYAGPEEVQIYIAVR